MTIHRRNFLKQGGLAAAGILTLRIPALAATQKPYQGVLQPTHNIPADKSIDAAWIKSLYERGETTVYRKSANELKFIGMPAGGLHAGTVYLGGDGRLWLWQVYNDPREGIDPKTVLWNDGKQEVKVRNRDGACYVEPAIAANKRVLDQGFALKIESGGQEWTKELKEDDWQEVTFEATYPVAVVRFKHNALPVEVEMFAGGVFVPLDADDSALPATVFDIRIKNISGKDVKVTLAGWLENGARKVSAKDGEGERRNQVVRGDGFITVQGSFAAADGSSNRPDDGYTAITLAGETGFANTNAQPWPVTSAYFSTHSEAPATGAPSGILNGGIATETKSLAPQASTSSRFLLSWHFNHPLEKLHGKLKDTEGGFFYAARFKDAAAVGSYLARHLDRLWGATLRWRDTWYNKSTLPHWFLERTFLNIGTLATANTYRFASGRFWSWEGVNACEGTCTHVWQYAQAMGRIFPSLERDTRQRTDLGIAMQPDGGIIFRAEFEGRPAIDGQAGTILRIWREHCMSADNKFLTQNWPAIRKATQFMLAQDKNGDGLTDTPMENTLDAIWEGEIAWIAGLCIAAARAAEKLAEDAGDKAFAKICREYADKGGRNMSQLFNGEYFIHRPNAAHGRSKLGSYNTCHIDQVYGQSWAFQAGLGRLWNKEETLSALRALWKYNFTMDVGPYIKTHTGGRPYAVAGEGGMVMNTNPKNEEKAYGDNVTWQLGYFHECMSGFEHQVASHMMAEGMTDEAMVLTRVIHDRHHAARRNPFNEIECSDHYARAMASYGTFITACGFDYHGPKGEIRFAPAIEQPVFSAPFTAAEGWGTYSQENQSGGSRTCELELGYGSLRLKTFKTGSAAAWKKVTVQLNGKTLKATLRQADGTSTVELADAVRVLEGQKLQIQFS
ncbi:GH116 family glycosyl hydrolase [Chitinophaga caseinilytica]|uniref:GH116 family glycosyl hydrolase n=1 Tax=Chitinophaga caseinilytica TaxID=2267521 RepID=A0ABZ2ZBA5_9BACT